MLFSHALTALVALPLIHAAPQPMDTGTTLVDPSDSSTFQTRDNGFPFIADISSLWRRKGGGGGGGGGGGKGGGGGSSSSSGKGGGSGSSSSSSSGSGSSSNAGGSYAGGARTPYTSGARSPSGISPLFLGAGLGAGIGLAAYPGFWPYGAYAYPYTHPYSFWNRTAENGTASATATPSATVSSSSTSATATNAKRDGDVEGYMFLSSRQDTASGANETKPVTCLCAPYAVCGCDESTNSTFLDSIIGDGTYAILNFSVVNVADINGTSTIVLNGTLPNGTTASGGTESASMGVNGMSGMGGVWVVVLVLGGMVALL